jgi:hypothetical protein
MPAHALLPAVKRLLQQVEEVSGLPVSVDQQETRRPLDAQVCDR